MSKTETFNKIPTGCMSVVLMLLIAYLSLDSNPFDANRVRLFEGADKVVHCLMYLTLSVIMSVDVIKYRYPKKASLLSIIVCAIIAFLYSIGMEFLQGAMDAGRAASVADAVANLVGCVIGFFCVKFVVLQRLFKKKVK